VQVGEHAVHIERDAHGHLIRLAIAPACNYLRTYVCV
jgi:hypothetical protein